MKVINFFIKCNKSFNFVQKYNLENKKINRTRNTYRLTIINDDTYQDLVSFRITRLSTYIFCSTLFVFIVGFTILLIAFSPIKYYIPGYGTRNSKLEFQNLKVKVDSLEKSLYVKDQFLNNIQTVLNGNINNQLDTSSLKLNENELNN